MNGRTLVNFHFEAWPCFSRSRTDPVLGSAVRSHPTQLPPIAMMLSGRPPPKLTSQSRQPAWLGRSTKYTFPSTTPRDPLPGTLISKLSPARADGGRPGHARVKPTRKAAHRMVKSPNTALTSNLHAPTAADQYRKIKE